MAVMPMFPLGTVLFPGAVLPLHVFEPRYRALVADLLKDGVEPEFGVTLIERGSEVGGGETRSAVGTIARLVQLAQLDDGRFALVSVGTRRVAVNSWLPDDPYPLADVDDFTDVDVDAIDQAALEPVRAHLRRVLTLASELGSVPLAALDELSSDPLVASYQLAALAPVGPADQFALLCAPSPAERLRLLGEQLTGAEEVLRFRLAGGAAVIPDEWP